MVFATLLYRTLTGASTLSKPQSPPHRAHPATVDHLKEGRREKRKGEEKGGTKTEAQRRQRRGRDIQGAEEGTFL